MKDGSTKQTELILASAVAVDAKHVLEVIENIESPAVSILHVDKQHPAARNRTASREQQSAA